MVNVRGAAITLGFERIHSVLLSPKDDRRHLCCTQTSHCDRPSRGNYMRMCFNETSAALLAQCCLRGVCSGKSC